MMSFFIIVSEIFRRKNARKLIVLCCVVFFSVNLFLHPHCAHIFLQFKGFIYFSFGIPTKVQVIENSTYNVVYYKENEYHYLLNPYQACDKERSPPLFIVLVKSHPSHINERKVIRETWGNVSVTSNDLSYKVFFSMGVLKNHPESLQSDLIIEQSQNNDLIQENYIEDFHNLTVKLISQMKWSLSFCNSAKFWMTTDEDVYINIKNILDFLHFNSVDFIGHVHSGSSRNDIKSSKYYVPDEIYPGSYYPPYCPGSGYILSLETVKKLYKSTSDIPILYIDDVYMGILAHSQNVKPSHNIRFLGEFKTPTDLCSLATFFTSHGYHGEELKKFHTMILDFQRKKVDFVIACSLNDVTTYNMYVLN